MARPPLHPADPYMTAKMAPWVFGQPAEDRAVLRLLGYLQDWWKKVCLKATFTPQPLTFFH